MAKNPEYADVAKAFEKQVKDVTWNSKYKRESLIMKMLAIGLLASWFTTAIVSAEGSPPFSGHYKASDYQEDYRPQFHFSPQNGWMNDINAL